MLHFPYTPVPNILADKYLPTLSGNEIKILQIVLRQTYGWVDQKTGKRKVRDRISHTQFAQKTGLSKRTVSRVVQRLVNRGLVSVGDEEGRMLVLGTERRGKKLYYSFTLGQMASGGSGVRSIGEILEAY